jgi:hypothetical protein
MDSRARNPDQARVGVQKALEGVSLDDNNVKILALPVLAHVLINSAMSWTLRTNQDPTSRRRLGCIQEGRRLPALSSMCSCVWRAMRK